MNIKLNPSKSTGLKMSKKKREFRAMTIGEHCFDSDSRTMCKDCEYSEGLCFCLCTYSVYNQVDMVRDRNKPYKTKDGKYIFVEVKE